ncbi:hypothetical protein GQ42DRAFT_162752 [Ramicandelaber brevisporus]|nr:hypothetical protein GQ42DRAFT_162752 [Ramicandelaber brevisporus]
MNTSNSKKNKKQQQQQSRSVGDRDAVIDAEVLRSLTLLADQALREKAEGVAFKWQEKLFGSDSVSIEVMTEAKQFMLPGHYEEVVEERAVEGLCGLPTCSNASREAAQRKLGKKVSKKRISFVTGIVTDLTEMLQYCSDKCMTESREYSASLSTEPLATRPGIIQQPLPVHSTVIERKNNPIPRPKQPSSTTSKTTVTKTTTATTASTKASASATAATTVTATTATAKPKQRPPQPQPKPRPASATPATSTAPATSTRKPSSGTHQPSAGLSSGVNGYIDSLLRRSQQLAVRPSNSSIMEREFEAESSTSDVIMDVIANQVGGMALSNKTPADTTNNDQKNNKKNKKKDKQVRFDIDNEIEAIEANHNRFENALQPETEPSHIMEIEDSGNGTDASMSDSEGFYMDNFVDSEDENVDFEALLKESTLPIFLRLQVRLDRMITPQTRHYLRDFGSSQLATSAADTDTSATATAATSAALSQQTESERVIIDPAAENDPIAMRRQVLSQSLLTALETIRRAHPIPTIGIESELLKLCTTLSLIDVESTMPRESEALLLCIALLCVLGSRIAALGECLKLTMPPSRPSLASSVQQLLTSKCEQVSVEELHELIRLFSV